MFTALLPLRSLKCGVRYAAVHTSAALYVAICFLCGHHPRAVLHFLAVVLTLENRAKQKHVRFDRIYHSGSGCCNFLDPVMEFQRRSSQGAVTFCGKNLWQT